MRKTDPAARYAADYNHWLRPNAGQFVLGLTDWAQYTIGQISSISTVPKVGEYLLTEQVYLLLESDKATTELIAPLSAQVISVNDKLIEQPSLINSDCYHDGWLLILALENNSDLELWQSADWYEGEINTLFRK